MQEKLLLFILEMENACILQRCSRALLISSPPFYSSSASNSLTLWSKPGSEIGLLDPISLAFWTAPLAHLGSVSKPWL
jgi:hypothetical protein